MNYAHLVYGMQMTSAARASMYKQPKEDWDNSLSGANCFLNHAEADMRNCGVQPMFCPYIVALTVYFGTPSMFITLWFGFDYGTNPPLGTLII
jgi:hypothetical protein